MQIRNWVSKRKRARRFQKHCTTYWTSCFSFSFADTTADAPFIPWVYLVCADTYPAAQYLPQPGAGPSLHHMLFLKHQLLITHAQPPKHWIYQHSPATWPCLCSHPALQNQVPSSAFRCGNPSHKHSLYLQAGLLQVSPQSGLLSPKASSSKNATENTKQETPLILIKLWHNGIFSPRETSSWSYQFQVKAFVMCTSSCTKRQREFKEQQHPQASSPRVP